ncbi:factor arrest protein 11 [[Candida] railenensis]|uniref:Factor arrest protein 11 n=1 Tax=[Candida] railenensis TaxID=45579 RepID=A0A9P0QLN4_9ASCO|nr:factor arrest protein 11 [[Candida] railenensis]
MDNDEDNEGNSIDQLEDSIIDHPDAKTMEQILDTSLDETFQKKLNARADQITNSHYDNKGGDLSNEGENGGDMSSDSLGGIENEYQFLIQKTNLLYEYKDFNSLDVEISEWFTFNDLKVIGPLTYLADNYKSKVSEGREERLLKSYIKALKSGASDETCLPLLVYFCMGEYRTAVSEKQQQCQKIRENCKKLYSWGIIEYLLDTIIAFFDQRILADTKEHKNSDFSSPVSVETQIRNFRILTIFYFILSVALEEEDDSKSFPGLRDALSNKDILSKIVQFIEHWKWKPNSAYRIRSLIQILWKLLLVEFGDSKCLDKCDDFLCDLHEIIHKEGKDLPKNQLTCSPLDYYTFREDLMAKYPLFSKTISTNNELIKKDPYDFETVARIDSSETSSVRNSDYQFYMAMNENSNSLTNLIEMPRTNRSHTISSQLPSQTVHIATPVPSPPSTPSDYMSGGEKIRKSYHLNQAMPFIYPNADEGEIPYAIKEADEILKNSVYESYSNKQLWEERQLFMRQERGFISEYGDQKAEDGQVNDVENNYNESKFNYSESLYTKYPESKDQIKSLLRVESFYSKSMIRLNSLIETLVETIKSNKFDYDLNFPEWELNPETSCFTKQIEEQMEFNNGNYQSGNTKEKIQFMLMQQLEVVNVKEITLKASTGIISLLLRWFKKNHILKYWYLASLLFDQQYLSIMMDFLNSSFNNNNIQQMKQSSDYNMQNNNGNGNGNGNKNNTSNVDSVLYQNKIMNPKIELPDFEFFNNCLEKFPEQYTYELINKTTIQEFATRKDSNNINNILITKFNPNYCFILSNLLTIGDKILLGNITQRILTLSDLKPSDMFKLILINFSTESINKPILKMLKKLIPYQGRKWKSNNMELISQVYLQSKLSLRDSWLSGKDLENDFNNSYGQEIALRGLLQFYNMKRYPQQMEMLGYEILDNDFTALNLNVEY